MGDRDRLARMTSGDQEVQTAVHAEVRDPVYLIDFIDQKMDGWGTWILTGVPESRSFSDTYDVSCQQFGVWIR
jgi:hypothetical protein